MPSNSLQGKTGRILSRTADASECVGSVQADVMRCLLLSVVESDEAEAVASPVLAVPRAGNCDAVHFIMPGGLGLVLPKLLQCGRKLFF
mmetsp:Transcript_4541/g.9840  ORF Transcript_4541/g.9840 Transcript_4541/m.9840 type:complete len:89 (+) Transcript_4541:23-289(+)